MTKTKRGKYEAVCGESDLFIYITRLFFLCCEFFFNIFRSLSCGFLLFAGSVLLLLVFLRPLLGAGGAGDQEVGCFSLGFACLFFFVKAFYLFFGLLFAAFFFSKSVGWFVLGALVCLSGVVLLALPCFDHT